MENGVAQGNGRSSNVARAWAKDALGAIALAEGAICDRVVSALGHELPVASTNAFGGRVDVQTAEPSAIEAAIDACADLCAKGQRVALIATARVFCAARKSLESIRASRLGLVMHALVDGEADACPRGPGVGVLFASSVEESLDLSLIARRAGTWAPFFVVHERTRVRHKEPLSPPASSSARSTSVRRRPVSARRPIRRTPAHQRQRAPSPSACLRPGQRHARARATHRPSPRRSSASGVASSSSGGGDGAVVMVGIGGLGESLPAAERLRGRGGRGR